MYLTQTYVKMKFRELQFCGRSALRKIGESPITLQSPSPNPGRSAKNSIFSLVAKEK